MRVQPAAVVFLVSIIYLNCENVLGVSLESTTNGKRPESRTRGTVKFLIPQPTVKNTKFQVTSPAPPSVIAGRSVTKTASKRPVKPAAPNRVEDANQDIHKFPSLASLVYIDKPLTTSTPKPVTTNKRTTTPAPPPSPPRTSPIPALRRTTTAKPKTTPKKAKKMVNDFACPQPEKIPFQWFPLPCDSHKQCTSSMGKNYRCCVINSNSYKSCTKGIMKQVPEQKHTPLFGVPIKCPKVPLAELFWNVQTCETDNDCWPRVCCPDGRKKFCRSPNPEFKEAKNPFARQLMQPYKSATSFIQCTAPAPFDSFSKPCNSTLDCFPNLCCQEGAKRHCRPPQRSLFSMVANSVSRTLFGN